MGFLLVLNVEDLPLLFKGGDEFLTLRVGHKELLAVTLVLLFNLHFAHQVVLILNLVLDLANVLRHLSKVLLLEVVLVLLRGKDGGGEDGFNSVCYDEVFVAHETMNGFLVFLGYTGLLEAVLVGLLGD